MKIIKFPEINDFSLKEKVFALGKFESLHLGHRKILKSASEYAKKNNLEFGIMIFDQRVKDNLYSIDERKKFIREFNPEYIMIFEKNESNFNITKNEFNSFLLKINTSVIFSGEDFRYGKNREGNVNTLGKINSKIVKNTMCSGVKISTTKAIECVKNSDFIKYKNIIGHYFFYKGEVIHGKGNGKKLGMPTANIEYPDYKIDIEAGIYYSYVIYNGQRLPSLTSISNNPTFGKNKKTYETHILNFDNDIYGEEIYVEIIEKFRDPIKFNSIDELSMQLAKDKNNGILYFNL